jgi:hypothetical protein
MPSNDKEALSDVAAHCTVEGITSGNNRRKQHLQGTTTMTSRNDGRNWDMAALARGTPLLPCIVTNAQ